MPAELPGDLPSPAGTYTSIDSREKEALRPAPLNFSRPRPDRGASSNAPTPLSPTSDLDGRLADLKIHQPYVANRKVGQGARREEDNDKAAPPPVVRTKQSSPTRHPQMQRSENGTNTWIFKPYAGSVSTRRSSDASSAMTYESATTATDETESIAETASTAESISTSHSSVSDFAFDGRLGWNPRNMSQAERERQRWAGPSRLGKTTTSNSGSQGTVTGVRPSLPSTSIPSTSQGEASNATSRSKALIPQRSNGSQQSNQSGSSNESASSYKTVPLPPRLPRIVKRTSWDQMSERVNVDEGDSMSDTSSIKSAEWKSSEFDTSGLSIEQIHKLKKKGINPALYAEMKQARKGGGKKRNLIGPLTGGTFLS